MKPTSLTYAGILNLNLGWYLKTGIPVTILGNTTSIFTYDWPLYDESKCIQSTVEIVVQVNSKIRARISVSADATEEQLETLALAEEQVKKNLEGLTIRKKILVPGKLVNFIAN